jgi:hypothetical protein
MNMQRRILGLDLGNVIRPAVPNGQHGSFDLPGDGFLDSPDFPEALQCLLEARNHFDEIHLVSRIIEGRGSDRSRWLSYRGYDEIIPTERRHFCERYEEKEPICAQLGITHFVDDNLYNVLRHLISVRRLFWFRARLTPIDLDHLYLLKERRIRVACSWSTLLPQLISL